MKYSNPKIPEGINSNDENPLKEFALLAVGMIAIAGIIIFLFSAVLDRGSKYIPFAYEQKISTPIVDQFVSEYPNESTQITDYLQQLADSIVPLMALENEVSITLHYINSDTVNGMATLGGNIFIFRGLLEKLPNENALVMLLAHEIAHVKLRHPVRALSKGVLISIVSAIISGQSNADVSKLLLGTSQLALLGFSRTQEQDADDEAIELSQSYYQHTQGAIALFDVLLAESSANSLSSLTLFNSHPDITARMANVEKVTHAKNWNSQGKIVDIPEQIQQRLLEDKLAQEQIVE